MNDLLPVQRDVGLILAAAGQSRRFGKSDKLLESLHGKPVFLHSLLEFGKIIPAENMVLVIAPEKRQAFASALCEQGIQWKIQLVGGGKSRQQSVQHGLAVLPQTARFVAVQDAARPYTPVQLLQQCITSARRRGSGVAAKRVTDTVKIASADGRVEHTPDRGRLWTTETPQVFCRSDLERAFKHLQESGAQVTDEAQALELLKLTVCLVEHDWINDKITFPIDLRE